MISQSRLGNSAPIDSTAGCRRPVGLAWRPAFHGWPRAFAIVFG
jgi:hypothetical protein